MRSHIVSEAIFPDYELSVSCGDGSLVKTLIDNSRVNDTFVVPH